VVHFLLFTCALRHAELQPRPWQGTQCGCVAKQTASIAFRLFPPLPSRFFLPVEDLAQKQLVSPPERYCHHSFATWFLSFAAF
jgi:hypothetical protein